MLEYFYHTNIAAFFHIQYNFDSIVIVVFAQVQFDELDLFGSNQLRFAIVDPKDNPLLENLDGCEVVIFESFIMEICVCQQFLKILRASIGCHWEGLNDCLNEFWAETVLQGLIVFVSMLQESMDIGVLILFHQIWYDFKNLVHPVLFEFSDLLF